MVWAGALGTALVVATALIHISILTNLGWRARRAAAGTRGLLLLVLVMMLAHSVEILAYAGGYFLIANLGLGHITGEFTGSLFDYVYYSTVSYTSLGLGDVYPHGPARLLTGIEALNGLFLIGWSVMFTYPTLQATCCPPGAPKT